MGPFTPVLIGLAILGSLAACSEPAGEAGSPPVRQTEPQPGDPPVLWVGGTLEEVSDSLIAIREGEGPTLSIERFSAGATGFFRLADAEWRRLPEEEVALVEVGGEVCVEALLDEGTFLALRVFLGVGCGPG